ncbi:hypothetical protein FJT64_021358 [Amphibalanus amphitrite]|uniref:Uncharacterized protein n=1 Tax=Amphibalanus amphitrite TaxID=1232801 RepID=A0A6A4WXX0_AMPAM|nr:hypothetical protein FJT64_021358 [Amphibalanus amphitrite]
MTSTRAPTPWSATEPDDDDDATDEGLEEDEQLERADSSGSSSPFESVAATTDSSYHTLPTASSSVERADQVGDRPAEETVQPRQMAAAEAEEKTTQGAEPADHHMTRYAGLEGAAAAPEPRPVPSGRSDSAVTPPGEAAAGRGRSAASDSRLGVRSSSPEPLTGEDSGVQLEAKRSTTDLPPQ